MYVCVRARMYVVQSLSSLEMESVTRVQILDKTAFHVTQMNSSLICLLGYG